MSHIMIFSENKNNSIAIQSDKKSEIVTAF